MSNHYVTNVTDLTNPEKNVIYNMTHGEAVECVRSGDAEKVRRIDGQFSLVSVDGKTIRMARSLGRPMRYFIAKRPGGPELVIAERIDTIYDYLKRENLDHQFHPSYTRMIPAHYITTIELLGCPDPNPVYTRFFRPGRNRLTTLDPSGIGKMYIGTIYEEIRKWLSNRANDGPLGVTFSAGIDSGAVFILTYKALLELGQSPSRLKAFTLSVEGGGEDLVQSQQFLKDLGLDLFLEVIEAEYKDISWKHAVKVVEDYKPLDIESATMNLALMQGIRNRYPGWKYIIAGEGGNENLKDYPIEENPELTIKSVLNNLMLYHEGWGVDSIKHSLTYSGGLSRGIMRSYATGDVLGFETFSPYTLPNVIEVSEGIPFIDLTGWDHKKLYDLKGEIVSKGVKAITGYEMPVFPKRRFQHGVATESAFEKLFPEKEIAYRKEFLASYE
ncbi:MAG: asparagine synthase-related protein [Bacteroidales bacterium]|jgi:asparagine synthase (glutamine-hydrolysing)|nr:asparagine synthase-related protein [Bacteroidales bacterium]